MPPTPGPGELWFIFMMMVFVLFGEKIPRIADALGRALRGTDPAAPPAGTPVATPAPAVTEPTPKEPPASAP
jgi:hypothetical protein